MMVAKLIIEGYNNIVCAVHINLIQNTKCVFITFSIHSASLQICYIYRLTPQPFFNVILLQLTKAHSILTLSLDAETTSLNS